jgi:CRP/FNR family cyclic AMP-dependent transcriptional regulator
MRKVLFIFSVLTDGDVEWMAKTGERVHIDAGTVFIPSGANVDNLYFVLDGEIEVKTPRGERISTLLSGEIIGELSLVDPAPTGVSLVTLKDTTVLKLTNREVRAKLGADTAFAARFYRALCVFLAHRIRNATKRIGQGAASAEDHAADELHEEMLDNVHLAGARFDRMLKRLAG